MECVFGGVVEGKRKTRKRFNSPLQKRKTQKRFNSPLQDEGNVSSRPDTRSLFKEGTAIGIDGNARRTFERPRRRTSQHAASSSDRHRSPRLVCCHCRQDHTPLRGTGGPSRPCALRPPAKLRVRASLGTTSPRSPLCGEQSLPEPPRDAHCPIGGAREAPTHPTLPPSLDSEPWSQTVMGTQGENTGKGVGVDN